MSAKLSKIFRIPGSKKSNQHHQGAASNDVHDIKLAPPAVRVILSGHQSFDSVLVVLSSEIIFQSKNAFQKEMVLAYRSKADGAQGFEKTIELDFRVFAATPLARQEGLQNDENQSLLQVNPLHPLISLFHDTVNKIADVFGDLPIAVTEQLFSNLVSFLFFFIVVFFFDVQEHLTSFLLPALRSLASWLTSNGQYS